MPNGISVKQYRPSGPIKVVRSADSSSNSNAWKASETSTMVNIGILQERELFFNCLNGVHGSVDHFVFRLAGIYTYPDVSIGFLF